MGKVSFHPPAITLERNGCRVIVRRVPSVDGEELFLTAEPQVAGTAADQATFVFEGVCEALSGLAEGRNVSILTLNLYLQNIARDRDEVRAALRQSFERHGLGDLVPVSFEIEQPPADELACFTAAIQVLLTPLSASPMCTLVHGPPEGPGEAGTEPKGVRVAREGEVHLYASGLYGRGEAASEQALSMFQVAEAMLEKSGLAWTDVVRTWIHLAQIDQDYSALNEARRSFFQSRSLNPVPASTGIGGQPVSPEHRLSLGLYACRLPESVIRHKRPMSASTLNEAPTYGADFVRGMRVEDGKRVSLYVSGTASIDEEGRTAHVGNIEAQIERMLLNVSALLTEQGADARDIVSATTYLKEPGDRGLLLDRYQRAGFQGFPHTLVIAPICRPELLCEVEVVAVRALGPVT
ncbi:MAG: hypothetical protein CBC48_17005 [bacterium TMED88]|nr:hypothetical protein [Deltaproteobacteria bacterium]OUV24987.1 MAG: hypothetical protein CBC48_17005 [bacterium TMED88]